MLAAQKLKIIEELVASSTKEELIWINGYLSGIMTGAGTTAQQPAEKPAVGKITIAYGTETGNSKKLASGFAAAAKGRGIGVKLVSFDQYRLNDLQKEEYLLAVISTQGDGEPPTAAKKFYDHIHLNGFKLNQLKYGVLALGDTSYPLFCKAGEDVDEQLQKMGAKRIISLQKCDTDYEAEANSWFAQVLQSLSSGNTATPAMVKPATVKKPAGKQIHTGTVLTNINLNFRGSNKQTHHIEIAAEDVSYQPGDSIGLVPSNPLAVVENILSISGADPARQVVYRNEPHSLRDLLLRKLNVTYLPERVVRKYAQIVRQDIPDTSIGLLDLLKIYSVKDAAQFMEVVDILEPIAPRLYSISSSPEAHSGEIHITVSRDSYCVNDEPKYGLCSDFLTQVKEEETIEFYIHHNNRFRLPAADKDIIMIGPGTGIAPFRSFLAEREAAGAEGRNWLFFGDQHFTTDFLYQTEIQGWLETGILAKVNVAFSRDQQEKIYVQHKMMANGAELFQWLESGALLYVCGCKDPMSDDVEKTLVSIIAKFGNRTEEAASEYLLKLKEGERYLLDVY